ncbi:MAG TPA: ribonuclease P protein component, partial [Gammaproteobacteria bacterium]|nr:ribonuclease P protein component [Gammaproteobacteria bacterium]
MGGRGERFGRHLRLLKPVEYRRVFANPVRSSDGSFTVLARANELGYPRLGLAIARKQLSTAVARNRVKRAVRESFRRHRR